MTAFVALLRAVNVGGTGKLPMGQLARMCEAAGFTAVRTYIASGNVVFGSKESEAAVEARLERTLHAYAGKPVGVLVRTAAEIAEVLAKNPFPRAAPNRTVAIFLDARRRAIPSRPCPDKRTRRCGWGPARSTSTTPTGLDPQS
jgi:uncharacterized protein (DUF1697 family)